MRRNTVVVLLLSVSLASSAAGGEHGAGCGGTHCIVPPPPFCPPCTDPCQECRLRLCPAWKAKEAQGWIEQLLHSPDFKARRCAADELGCRWHADFCLTPEVLQALIVALQCDPCWEVRKAAATAIRRQNARTPEAVAALYIAARLDPHYVVRTRANESLDILLALQRPCFRTLFKAADELIKKLSGKYKPGSKDCCNLYALCLQLCQGGESGATPASGGTSPPESGMEGPEELPPPTSRSQEAEGKGETP